MSQQKSRFLQWIDHRVRVTIHDGRMLVGTYLAYDKHMNLVLADTDQFRQIKNKKTKTIKQIKRTLGLVILRGQNIVSLTIQSQPINTIKKFDQQLSGKSAPLIRGGITPNTQLNKSSTGMLLQPSRPDTGKLIMPNIPLPQPKLKKNQ